MIIAAYTNVCSKHTGESRFSSLEQLMDEDLSERVYTPTSRAFIMRALELLIPI